MSQFQIATLTIQTVEAIEDVHSTGGTIFYGWGNAWKVTARDSWGDGSVLTWTGDGECPWRVNQKVIVTVAADEGNETFPPTVGTVVEDESVGQ